MKKFYITTDMTADFPSSLVAQQDNFKIINMSYVLDGVLYDGEETPYLSSVDFFGRLKKGAAASTSMVTQEQTERFLRPILSDGYDVLHFSFSSALSGSYKSYECAIEKLKKEFPDRKILLVDSLCASLGQGMLVYFTLKQRDAGKSIEECKKFAEDLRQHVIHIFTVDDMMHLYRGGRVKRGVAVIGNVIQLKPVLVVDENGCLKPTYNQIGKKPALKTMLEKFIQKRRPEMVGDTVFIGHGDAEGEANWLAQKITEKTGVTDIVIDSIGSVIGTHVGAGLVTMFFIGDNRAMSK